MKKAIFFTLAFFLLHMNAFSQEIFKPNILQREAKQINFTLPFFQKSQNLNVEIVEGYVVFEGDIILYMNAPSERDAGIPGNNFRWVDGIIPYEIENGHPDNNNILSAINLINQNTAIRVQPRNGQTDFVRFVNGGGCASFVGRQGGRQDITIGGCPIGSIQHEILHAAGMFHEQSRSDRDNFVRILTQNIMAGRENNFRRVENTVSICNYDFGSIMHYPATAFGINGQVTIQPINPLPAGIVMGQRTALSQCDIDGVNNLYRRGWSGEAMLGAANNEAKTLTVSRNADGRLEVFYIGTDNKLYHNWQLTPSGAWNGQAMLGAANNEAKILTVSQNADGRLEVFYIGTDNRLYHNWQLTPNGAWNGQAMLGAANNEAKTLTVSRNADGRLEVFYIGTDNRLYHNWQLTPNGAWNGQAMLGAVNNEAKTLTVSRNADGRLEVFYIGTDNRLYHNWQLTPNGAWNGQAMLGTATNEAKTLTVSQNADGRLEVFYIGTDNRLYHNWQLTPNGTWSGQAMLGTATNEAKTLTVSQNADGRLEVFYIGTDNRLYHNWQLTPNGVWSGQAMLGTATNEAKTLTVSQNADGRLEVFYIGTDNRLYHNWQL